MVITKYEHHVILDINKHNGFGDKWCLWVKIILPSCTSSVLLNGTLGKIFHCKRGVRHRDPLSPLLFVLDVDLLQVVPNKAMGEQQLKRNVPLNNYPNFRVVQYVNHTCIS